MCYRGDLVAKERLHNDSICVIENGGIRRVRHTDNLTSNFVYVQNWRKITDNEFVEEGDYVRYKPIIFEIDKKQSSVCKTDDYSVRTKFAKSDTKDDDLIKMITYLLNHDQLDSNRKVKIIRDTIDICRRIDEIN